MFCFCLVITFFLYIFIFPDFLQLCSVRMGWYIILVALLALPHVPVFSRVHTPSVVPSLAWKAVSAPLAQSYMVRQIDQSHILLNMVRIFIFLKG